MAAAVVVMAGLEAVEIASLEEAVVEVVEVLVVAAVVVGTTVLMKIEGLLVEEDGIK